MVTNKGAEHRGIKSRNAHELEGGAVVLCSGSLQAEDRNDYGNFTDILDIDILAANETIPIAKFSESSKLTRADFDTDAFDECPYRRYPCTLVVNKVEIPNF